MRAAPFREFATVPLTLEWADVDATVVADGDVLTLGFSTTHHTGAQVWIDDLAAYPVLEVAA